MRQEFRAYAASKRAGNFLGEARKDWSQRIANTDAKVRGVFLIAAAGLVAGILLSLLGY